MARYCDKCGKTVKADDSFCSNCGNPITSQTTWAEPGKSFQPTPTPTETKPRRFYRSREDRWIAGVCGGLGEYFNIDPVLIRLAFIFIGLGWVGIFIYILLAIFTEENPYQKRRI